MTPLSEFENLNYDKRIVNAQIREYIAALLIKRDRLEPGEEHLRDFIDIAITHFKNKIDHLNEEAVQASKRLPKFSR